MGLSFKKRPTQHPAYHSLQGCCADDQSRKQVQRPETNHPPSVASRKTNGKWGKSFLKTTNATPSILFSTKLLRRCSKLESGTETPKPTIHLRWPTGKKWQVGKGLLVLILSGQNTRSTLAFRQWPNVWTSASEKSNRYFGKNGIMTQQRHQEYRASCRAQQITQSIHLVCTVNGTPAIPTVGHRNPRYLIASFYDHHTSSYASTLITPAPIRHHRHETCEHELKA